MKKMIPLILVILSLTLTLPAALAAEEPSFSDVPISHWAFDEIETAVDKGITNGYADGTFKPANSVSYAHFSAFIARAFFPTEIKTYEEHNPDAAWWASSVYTLEANNILPGTKMAEAARTSGSYDSVLNSPITRYDMAQIMYNVLKLNITSMPAGKTSGIGDWSGVPAGYRDAVSVCYALGVLNGQNDGNFGGNNYMNRAQGCVVISRLENYIENGSAGTETVTPTEPETPVENEKPVQTTGTLANGMAITEDNAMEILEELKEEYPHGSAWGKDKYYRSSTLGPAYECAAFAFMVSDRIFGDLPVRAHTDYDNIKVGDIVEMKGSNGQTAHWEVVTTPKEADGFFGVVSGNNDGLVGWGWSTLEPFETYGYVIHTRYPI